MLRSIPDGNQRRDGNEKEIERPDAQDAANVKRTSINGSTDCFFADEQRGDQECAQREKEINAIGTGAGDSANNGDNRWKEKMVGLIEKGVVGNDMENKNSKESEKPKGVKFRPIKSLALLLCEVRVRRPLYK